MKICAIICEYNPFHNGHLHHIREAKRLSNADYILCLMSGNFVQRGETAIQDKYTRAKNALCAGADIVLELPTVYATSNAEIFAKGSIQLLSAIPSVETLCFGAENADADAFLSAATLFNNEPTKVSTKIKQLTDEGFSYAKARAEAWKNIIPENLVNSPNNILGLEYTRAILRQNSKISILPIPRVGNGYNSQELKGDFASATAIRKGIEDGVSVDDYIPSFALEDLSPINDNLLDSLEKYAILRENKENIAMVCDCTEGLENAFKKAAKNPTPLVEQLTSARYTSSRIRRIALQNLLGIKEEFIRECLSTNLYLRVLAVRADKKDILGIISNTEFPLILRTHDKDVLNKTAKACFEKDSFAEYTYKLLNPSTPKVKNIFYE